MSMSDDPRTSSTHRDQLPTDPSSNAASSTEDHIEPDQTPLLPDRRVPSTRTGRAWASLCVAVLAFVVLITFMMQNTRSTEVSFLWMHGSIPLALALLIAAVGGALLTMVVGVARVTQLRRVARRPR
jgi:uncharacterized integral membrane protein